MAKRIVCIAVILTFAAVASVNAANVTLHLAAADGQWEVRATAEGDTEGIAAFSINVWGEGGVDVTGSTNESPTGYDIMLTSPNWLGEYGFKNFRSDGTNGMGIAAGQDAIYDQPGNSDPGKDWLVIQGVGITAGTRDHWVLVTPPFGWEQQADVEWDGAPDGVLLASGTYTGELGLPDSKLFVEGGSDQDPTAGWSMLNDTGNSWSGPGHISSPENVTGDSLPIPEPGTMLLLAMGAVGMLLFRWRRK